MEKSDGKSHYIASIFSSRKASEMQQKCDHTLSDPFTMELSYLLGAKIKRVVFRMSMRGLTDDADCPIPFYVQRRYIRIEKCVHRQSLASFQWCACVVCTDWTQTAHKRMKNEPNYVRNLHSHICCSVVFAHMLRQLSSI